MDDCTGKYSFKRERFSSIHFYQPMMKGSYVLPPEIPVLDTKDFQTDNPSELEMDAIHVL